MPKLAFHWQILIALALAVVAGSLTAAQTAVAGVPLVAVYDFFGTLFLNGLKMLIVPLIAASIIVGVSGVGGASGLGRLGGKTVLYYLCTSTLAVLVGLTLVNLLAPGVVDGQPAKDMLGLSADTEAVVKQVADKGAGDVVDVFLRMVPPNIVEAAAEGQMLGLIFFSLLFGYFITRTEPAPKRTLERFWQGVLQVMIGITHLVMRFAPIGVFALVAGVVASSGLAAFRPLAVFFLTVLAALAVHMLVVLPLVLRLVAGVSPRQHYRAMAAALLTAFSTSSSAGTLPVTLDCVQRRAGVSNRVASFVLPLGATVNMDGTALYECVAVLFIAQAYGLDLGVAQQLTVVVLALMTSIGVAGIPSASLVAIALILGAVGLPAEAVGLILAVDRPLDMCRTAVNVLGDTCGAVTIARSEGEADVLKA